MIRLGAMLALASSGCSLILDFSGSSEPPADAAFTQVECDFKEPNNTLAEAQVLDLAEVGPAAICPTNGNDDRDVYRVTLPANTNATFKITYFFSPTGDLDIQLTDLQGSMISASRSFDNDEVIVCPGSSPPCVGPLAAGDYFFEVFPGQPGMANRYDISITFVP